MGCGRGWGSNKGIVTSDARGSMQVALSLGRRMYGWEADVQPPAYFNVVRNCNSRLAISGGSGAYPKAEHWFWPEVSIH
jgi:hypothetical protein